MSKATFIGLLLIPATLSAQDTLRTARAFHAIGTTLILNGGVIRANDRQISALRGSESFITFGVYLNIEALRLKRRKRKGVRDPKRSIELY